MKSLNYFLISATILITACSPTAGPDKAAGGTLLGAMWGAGAGAVIGNQVGNTGGGVAVGAGFGAVEGLLTGAAQDSTEESLIDNQQALASLKMQNLANERKLKSLHDSLEDEQASMRAGGGIEQVYFDLDTTSLKAGSIQNLEIISESLKKLGAFRTLHVMGHADDTGDTDYNKRLSEARAREVAAVIAREGVGLDIMKIEGAGSTRPVASNTTKEGRSMNRRVDIWID